MLSREEAARLVREAQPRPPAAAGRRAAGVFELGDNRVLITDLRVLDDSGRPCRDRRASDPEAVEAAAAQSGALARDDRRVPARHSVSVKADMLAHHRPAAVGASLARGSLRPNDRWYATFPRYVELIADKVRALGGDPWSVPATPTATSRCPARATTPGSRRAAEDEAGGSDDFWRRHCPLWLALLILLLLLILLILLLVR